MSDASATNAVHLLERSLEKNRLAHAYLFSGDSLDALEEMARTLAKALNCQTNANAATHSLTSCGQCDACRRIQHGNHPDVLWVRPESKSRLILIDQMRELMQTVHLKPTVAEFKIGVIVAADRLNVQAANAFLKTLEEPPPKSVLILLTTEPQRILETILSRCLRLNFGGDAAPARAQHVAWLAPFSEMAARQDRGLLARYQLLGLVMKKLGADKEQIEKNLTERSPLEQYGEQNLEPKMREKLEDELTAAIEAEYRRQRAEVVGALQWWLRDIWLQTIQTEGELLCFPDLLPAAKIVAARLTSAEAMRNLDELDRLHRQLNSNVQEALALEVGLLKLKL
jgi:DNA polymerase III subunit delta'